jgi:hypothetical protein
MSEETQPTPNPSANARVSPLCYSDEKKKKIQMPLLIVLIIGIALVIVPLFFLQWTTAYWTSTNWLNWLYIGMFLIGSVGFLISAVWLIFSTNIACKKA